MRFIELYNAVSIALSSQERSSTRLYTSHSGFNESRSILTRLVSYECPVANLDLT